jgi:hypothetical protein
MNNKILAILALFTAFSMFFISCKSTPAATPAPASTQTPAAPAAAPAPAGDSQLTDAKAKTEEARKRAMDFQCPEYFPTEWEEVEGLYSAANDLPVSNAVEIQAAANIYNALTPQYDDLMSKAAPLYAQAREDELMAKRQELISTGFTVYFPEYLKNADDLSLAALSQFEAKDYYTAKDTADKALNEYDTLLSGAKVFLTRQEILDRGFREYDADNFDKADDTVRTALTAYEAGDKEAALASAEEAQLRYNIVLANGWKAYAAERRDHATAERQLALEEKVNIAHRNAFREADAMFTQAEDSYKSETFNEAAIYYTDSEARFAIARIETEERRQRALEAIRMAEEKVVESNETAVEAGRIIEGVSR